MGQSPHSYARGLHRIEHGIQHVPKVSAAKSIAKQDDGTRLPGQPGLEGAGPGPIVLPSLWIVEMASRGTCCAQSTRRLYSSSAGTMWIPRVEWGRIRARGSCRRGSGDRAGLPCRNTYRHRLSRASRGCPRTGRRPPAPRRPGSQPAGRARGVQQPKPGDYAGDDQEPAQPRRLGTSTGNAFCG